MGHSGKGPVVTEQRQRVVVTGATGVIGRLVMEAWRLSGAYEAVGLARTPGPYTDVLADTDDLDALVEAFRGADAVVHMAGASAVDSSWDAVLASNIIGVRNVFEAARLAGVRRVVFASSNHAVGTFELANVPSLWDLDDDRQIDHTAEIMPDSYYGVSKAYGEAMARYFVDHHGLEAVCLRIGGVRDPQDPSHPANLWRADRDGEEGIEQARRRARAVWLSERDCVHLIERAIDADVSFAIVYGISDNPRKIWDIDHARRVLAYDPRDSAPADIFPDRTANR